MTLAPHLLLLQRGPELHAGLGYGGALNGRCFCDDGPGLDAWFFNRQELFKGSRAWRHRYAMTALEMNDGCRACLDVMARIAQEAGWTIKDFAA